MTAAKAIPISDDELPKATRAVLPAVLAIVVFSLVSIWGAVSSEGFLEADAVTHYLYARFAFDEPHYFVNVWGRPLITGLYAAPAYFFGRFGVRVTSLIVAMLLLSWVTYAIAKGQRQRFPVLAMIFLLAQPMVFLHSFSELTELPFALILALAFLAYQRRQFMWMALLVGVSPLGRPEGFGFIGMAGLALVLHKQWRWIPYLFVFLLCWTYAGWRIFGAPKYDSTLPYYLHGLLWLKHEWPYAGESLYDRGNLFKYLALLPAVVSPFLFPAMLIGGWRSFANNPRSVDVAPTPKTESWAGNLRYWATDHRARCELLIAVIPLMILIGHSTLHALGKMASSGELRYLLVVAPFWALLASRGWEWLSMRLWIGSPIRWAIVLALLPCLIQCKFDVLGMTFGYKTLPLTLNDDMLAAKRFTEWYKAWPERNLYPRIMAAHPGVYLLLDQSPTDPVASMEWHSRNFKSLPEGVVIAWDAIYGVFNSDSMRVVTRSDLDAAGWISFPQPWPGDNRNIPERNPSIFLSPRDIALNDTPHVQGTTDAIGDFNASRTYVSPPRPLK